MQIGEPSLDNGFFLKDFVFLVVVPYCPRLEHEEAEYVDTLTQYLNREQNGVLVLSPEICSVWQEILVASVHVSVAHHYEHEHEYSA